MGWRDICCAMKHLLLFWPKCCLWCFPLFLFPPPLFILYFSPFLTYVFKKHHKLAWWVHCRASWTMLCLAHGSPWPLSRGVIPTIHPLPKYHHLYQINALYYSRHWRTKHKVNRWKITRIIFQVHNDWIKSLEYDFLKRCSWCIMLTMHSSDMISYDHILENSSLKICNRICIWVSLVLYVACDSMTSSQIPGMNYLLWRVLWGITVICLKISIWVGFGTIILK